MAKRVLIIGGYGNFGTFIAKSLAPETDIQLIIAGRSLDKATSFAKALEAANQPEASALDIYRGLNDSLKAINPDIVIHTSGPYQDQGYDVAQACIDQKCHYIDLADARDFVANIGRLDEQAKKAGVLICSGASSVPCLTSAIIDHYQARFQSLDRIDYGIATAHLTNRGFATTSAVLSYAGKPFTTKINGQMETIYGWLDLKFRKFWGLGNRPLGNCDIPDLALFPERYPEIKTIRFQAGLEITFLHLGLWFLSFLCKYKLFPPLKPMAGFLLQFSRVFDMVGKDNSGFYMTLQGKNEHDEDKHITFDLVANKGDGLYIPSMPAILMAKKLAREDVTDKGAMPCIGFISLDEYLEALKHLNIKWQVV